jgi:hypothetical protein
MDRIVGVRAVTEIAPALFLDLNAVFLGGLLDVLANASSRSASETPWT